MPTEEELEKSNALNLALQEKLDKAYSEIKETAYALEMGIGCFSY